MIQVESCEQALIKTNMKSIQNHQSKTMLLFETYTLEILTLTRAPQNFPIWRDERAGMQREILCNSGSKAASKLQGRIARAFSSNSLVKTMEMTAVLQYILTEGQWFGSQDYYKKSRYFGLLVYYSTKTSRHRQNGLSYVPKKVLTWMLREAKGVLKATVGNRVTT